MTINRIHILGTPGSGKTFLAKKLSNTLRIKHYDLDDIFWKRKYNEKRKENERNKLLDKICKGKRWIIEGAYSSWVEKSIKGSDLVIWIDMPFHTLMWRIFGRYFKRRKQKRQENWKDILALAKYVRNYKRDNQPAGYYKHKELIEKHKVDFVYIKSKKELDGFFKDFLGKLTS